MTLSLIENLNLLEKEIQKKKQGQPTHLNKFSIGVPSAYEEFVSIRNRFKNFAVILYI